MPKTNLEKISGIEEEIRQLENRRKQLIQQQKSQDRKARDHRLCKRGAYLESILPGTIPLTDEQFYQFLNKTLKTDYARRILDGLKKQSVDTNGAEPSETAQRLNGGNTAGTSGNTQGKAS